MTNRPIRVVFVLTNPDAVGGTERATYHLTAELAGFADLDVSVVGVIRDSDSPHFAGDVGVPLRHLVDRRNGRTDTAPSLLVEPRWESAFSAETDRAIASALWADRPDVVVATTPALLALLVQVAPPNSVIVGVEHRATAARGPTAEPLHRFGRLADAYVSLTEAGTDWFSSMMGPDAPRLVTIPNLLPERFAPRSSLERPLVLAAGRLVRSKQFAHAIRAFAAARRPGWQLRILGDGPERDRLRRLILSLGVHDHVTLVRSVPDVAHELAKSSMLVMSSLAEGQPLVALEALAAGVPIVSYDCPVGPRTIIEHDVNGFLVAPNDVDALADRMAVLMDDVALRDRLGTAARGSRTRFGADRVAGGWHGLVVELAGTRPRRTRRSPERAPAGSAIASELGGSGVGGPSRTEPWVPAGGLLVHVGPHKTGTTSLQGAFAASRERLRALGVIYPGTRPAPHGAVMSRLGTFRGWDDAIAPGSLDSWAQLCVETRTAHGTVVVSSEALCHATSEQAAQILGELRPGPARVAITLRPLEQLLPSSWQEYVKGGWTTPFDDFLRFVLSEPESPENPTPTFWERQDHGALVQRWADVIGAEHVVVIVADPARRDHLVRSFEDLLGLAAGTLPLDGVATNRSLSFVEVEVLRRLNGELRDLISWDRYNATLRQRGTAALVERRRPSTGEAMPRLPAWALDRARSVGAEAADRIRASGVHVRGDLVALGEGNDAVSARPDAHDVVAPVPVDHVPVDIVPVDIVDTLVAGITGTPIERTEPGPGRGTMSMATAVELLKVAVLERSPDARPDRRA